MSRQPEPGRAWAMWLGVLIVAIALSPRLRVGEVSGKAIDIRVQDLLLMPTLVMLALSPTGLPSLRPAWGRWGAAYVVWAITATLLILLIHPDLGLLRSVAFLGRGLEMFLIAITVAGCYLAARSHAARGTARVLTLAIWANLAWMVLQIATGTQRVLFGSAVGDTIEAYGPKLLGEPSAFGAGFFCAAAVGWGVARFRAGHGRWGAMAMVVVAAFACYFVQSRVSLAAIAVVLVLFVLRPRAGGPLHWFNAAALAAATTWVTVNMPTHLQGRFSPAGVAASTDDRVVDIWGPLMEAVSDRPILGIGPGRLGTWEFPQTEAHNIFLRAALDYGVVAAVLLAGLLVTIAVRAARAQAEGGAEVRLFAAFAGLLVVAVTVTGLVQESLTAVTSTHLTMLGVGLFAGALIAERRRAPAPAPAGRSSASARRSSVTAG